MRISIFLILLVLLSGACREKAGYEPAGASASDIQIVVPSAGFTAGSPRVPFVLYAGIEKVADAQRVLLTAFDLATETPAPVWSGEAISYSDYEVPYWVAYPELEKPGFWGLAAEVTLADGAISKAQFAIEVVATSSSPEPGERPPASQNRTLATEGDIHQLSSGTDPEPGLYALTIADAMRSGRPTVVSFATPAFCASQLCAPVVDSVEQLYESYGPKANFIHIEVYKSFDPLVFADEMAEWGLETEPWTFVLDKEGRVVAKFGGPVSPRELAATLEPLLP